MNGPMLKITKTDGEEVFIDVGRIQDIADFHNDHTEVYLTDESFYRTRTPAAEIMAEIDRLRAIGRNVVLGSPAHHVVRAALHPPEPEPEPTQLERLRKKV